MRADNPRPALLVARQQGLDLIHARTHGELAASIWGICNLLRGPYKRNEYLIVILPSTVLRRFVGAAVTRGGVLPRPVAPDSSWIAAGWLHCSMTD